MTDLQLTSDFAAGCPVGAQVLAAIRGVMADVPGGPWLVVVSGADDLGRAQSQVPGGMLRVTLSNNRRVSSILIRSDAAEATLVAARARALSTEAV